MCLRNIYRKCVQNDHKSLDGNAKGSQPLHANEIILIVKGEDQVPHFHREFCENLKPVFISSDRTYVCLPLNYHISDFNYGLVDS